MNKQLVRKSRRISQSMWGQLARAVLETLEGRQMLSRPSSVASSFTYETAPNALSFTFDQDVSGSLSPANTEFVNLSTDTQVSPDAMSLNYSNNIATFTFPGYRNPWYVTGVNALPNGNYQSILSATEVTNSVGEPLTADAEADFFALNADANHDRVVNGDDFSRLQANWGSTSATLSQGDFNYDGRVNGFDFGAIASLYGATLPAPPSGPSTLTASSVTDDPSTKIALVWTAPASGSWDGFHVYRSADGINFTRIAEISDPTATTYTDTGRTNGTKYTYRVRPYTVAAGDSTAMNKAWAVTVPPVPTGLTVGNQTADSLDLTWTNHDNGETAVEVWRTGPDGEFVKIATLPAGTQTYTDTALADDTSYIYRVRSISTSAVSMFSLSVSGTKLGWNVDVQNTGYGDAPPVASHAPVLAPIHLAVRGVSSAAKNTTGQFVPNNDNFDEGNVASGGGLVADNQPDATAGDRILPDDPELLDSWLFFHTADTNYTWSLNFPSTIKVWQQNPQGIWSPISAGTSYAGEYADGVTNLKIEGITNSASVNDTELLATLVRSGSTSSDAAKITVLHGGHASIPVLNPGFESTVVPNGQSTTDVIGWTSEVSGTDATGQAIVKNPMSTELPTTAYEGSNVLQVSLQSAGDPSAAVTLKQKLATLLVENTRYTISAKASTTSGKYAIELWAGDTMLAVANRSVATGTRETRTIKATYVAPASGDLLGLPLEARIVLQSASGSDSAQASFDGFTAQSSAPTGAAVYGIDLEVDGVGETDEITTGAVLALNDGFDESNVDATDAAVDDEFPNYPTRTRDGGNRIVGGTVESGQFVGGDPDLKTAVLRLTAPTFPDGSKRKGLWGLSYDTSKFLLWQWWDENPNRLTRPEAHWGYVISGDVSKPDVIPQALPYFYRVEALVPDADITVHATVTPVQEEGTTEVDDARIKVFSNSPVVPVDLDVFEDANADGIHDNSIQAEQLEASTPTSLPLVSDGPPEKLALTVNGLSANQTIALQYDTAELQLYYDAAGTQPIPANTPLAQSTFGLSGSGTAVLYGSAITPGSLGSGVSLSVGGLPSPVNVFLGGVLGGGGKDDLLDDPSFHDGTSDNKGGLDDGDGNQPLTDRDGWWTKPVKPDDTAKNQDGQFLIIGFAGHSQGMGFDTVKGQMWNIKTETGTYQIGQEFQRRGYPVQLFPEDPGNHENKPEIASTQLCGDGVLGAVNPGKGNQRVDSSANAIRTGALAFLIDAIKGNAAEGRLGKRKIGLFGYSHGGGSLQILIKALVNSAATDQTLHDLVVGNGIDPPPVTFFWTGDIDAVNIIFAVGSNETDAVGVPLGEDDYPLAHDIGNANVVVGTTRHFNIYQNGDLPGDGGGDNVPLSGNDQSQDSSGISFQGWRGPTAVLTQIFTDAPGSIWVKKYGNEGLDHSDSKHRGIAEDRSNKDWVHEGVQELLFKDFDAAIAAL